MRFTARLLSTLPCLRAFVIGGCVALGVPGKAGGGRAGVTDADGGAAASAGNDSPGCAQGCAPLECGEGMHPAPLSGECCPTVCEPDDCSLVDCPALNCPSGQHASKAKGSCCSVCTHDPAPGPGATC